MRKLIAGNWKMNGSLAANQALVQALRAGVGAGLRRGGVPARGLSGPGAAAAGGLRAIALGAQDVSEQAGGAYTGKCRPPCWPSSACATPSSATASGASTRRERPAGGAQGAAALAAGITPIVCVGETLAERERARPSSSCSASCRP
jgi:triosephosphate isomerase